MEGRSNLILCHNRFTMGSYMVFNGAPDEREYRSMWSKKCQP